MSTNPSGGSGPKLNFGGVDMDSPSPTAPPMQKAQVPQP